MARVKNPPPGGRATRRPGRLLTKLTKGGNFVAQTWPRKRGPIKSPEQAETAEQFRLAQIAARDAHAWQYIEAAQQSEGTIWNRREILVKAAQGNLYEIYTTDGQFYGNWFVLAREIQALLDTVSDEVGAVLIRSGDGWVGLNPGPAGYVLTANGPDFTPSYQPGASAAAVYQWSTCAWASTFGGTDITVGSDYYPACDLELNKIAYRCGIYVGATYLLTICSVLANDRIDAILHQQDVTTATHAAQGSPVIPLSTPVVLSARQRYAILVSKSNGTAGSSLGMGNSREGQSPIPTMELTRLVRNAVPVPAPNDLLFETTGAALINCEWRGL